MTDRLNTNIASAQLGFIDFVIKPTFEVWSQYLSSVKIHLDNLAINRERWEELEEECETVKENGNQLLQRFANLLQGGKGGEIKSPRAPS